MWIIEMGGKGNASFFKRNIFTTNDEIENIRKKFNNIDVYKTEYMYDNKEQATALKIANFYLDFDRELSSEDEFEKVRKDALKGMAYLVSIFNIPLESIEIYFSGSKGLHIIVPREIMRIQPNQNLHRVFRSIAEEIKELTVYKSIDMQIYDCRRLFRLPNSINSKSGLYKIPLSYLELKWASLSEIKEIAKKEREVKFAKPIRSDRASMFYDKYVQEWEKKIKAASERKPVSDADFKRLKDLPPCVKYVLNNDVLKGQRNNTAIALTNFFQQQRYTEDEIIEILATWSETRCDPPLDENEITSVINSALKHQYKFGCSTLSLISECEKDSCPFFKKGGD